MKYNCKLLNSTNKIKKTNKKFIKTFTNNKNKNYINALENNCSRNTRNFKLKI